MNILLLQAVIFGIVEGITEWLPISSTGHMILIGEFIRPCASDEFMEMFFVVVQLGATLSLPILFRARMFGAGCRGGEHRSHTLLNRWSKIFVGALPCAICGIAFEILNLEERLYNYLTVAFMLIIYGVVFLFSERIGVRRGKEITDVDDISYSSAFKVGLFQVLSLIPGTSRSGSTVIGGMSCGISREASAEFSFLLAFPLMLGASAVKLIDLFSGGYVLTADETVMLAVGVLVSFVVSLLVIRFLMDFVRRHSFGIFGAYRIFIGILILIYTYTR